MAKSKARVKTIAERRRNRTGKAVKTKAFLLPLVLYDVAATGVYSPYGYGYGYGAYPGYGHYPYGYGNGYGYGVPYFF